FAMVAAGVGVWFAFAGRTNLKITQPTKPDTTQSTEPDIAQPTEPDAAQPTKNVPVVWNEYEPFGRRFSVQLPGNQVRVYSKALHDDVGVTYGNLIGWELKHSGIEYKFGIVTFSSPIRDELDEHLRRISIAGEDEGMAGEIKITPAVLGQHP